MEHRDTTEPPPRALRYAVTTASLLHVDERPHVGPVVHVSLHDAARALVAADVAEDRAALLPLAEHRRVVGRAAAGVVPDDDVAAHRRLGDHEAIPAGLGVGEHEAVSYTHL